MERSKEIEDFARKLGFNKVIFKGDFDSIGLFISKDYNTNRKLIERKNIKILVDPHVNNFRDSLHFRASGLDHVICNLSSENKVAIGVSLRSIKDGVMLGRVKQNIKLCRKYKVNVRFFTFAENKYELRSKEDMLAFLRAIGMTGKEAKDAMNY